MFYVIVDPENKEDAFYLTDDGGHIRTFETEDEAATASKDYSGPSIVLRPIIKVTQKTTYKVEKIK